jgi:hypothetical protein
LHQLLALSVTVTGWPAVSSNAGPSGRASIRKTSFSRCSREKITGGVNSASREMKFDPGGEIGRAPVAGKFDALIDFQLGALRIGNEEVDLEIAPRQQRDDGLAGIHHLARAEIDLLNRPADRRRDHALAEAFLSFGERVACGLGVGRRRFDHIGTAGQLRRRDPLLGLSDGSLVAVVLGDRLVELRR